MINRNKFRKLKITCPFCGNKEKHMPLGKKEALFCGCSWTVFPSTITTVEQLQKYHATMNTVQQFGIVVTEEGISLHEIKEGSEVDKNDKRILNLKVNSMVKRLEGL